MPSEDSYFWQKDYDEYSLYNFRNSRVSLLDDESFEDKDIDMKDEETKAKQKTEDESKKSTEESDGIENIHEPATDYSIIKKKESNNEEIISEQDINNTIIFYKNNNLNSDGLKINTPKNSSDIDLDETKDLIQGLLSDLKSENEKDVNILKRKRGRNGPGSTGGEHTKYSDDNLRRKCKHLVLKYTMDFINEKISCMYDGVNKGILTKKLLTINQKQTSNATVSFNKKFLYKKIKDIFSEDISTKYNNYLVNHNKALIQNLLNEPDPNKKITFENLFNLTFLDCLLHIRGEKYYEQLHGLKTFDELCKRFEDDKDYLELFKYYINNFEKVINKKRKRSSSKSY
jgi:hypothetical protein